ncbi:muscle-specific protein 300 kDa isoform X1 [Rhipicephalus sanguineus]|uniref:muscle-specific protein 300 kDa isoform X1 n=1 Tax=Rhipicephalus sanguineus TaxID=34632 RepID=UPI0020C4EAD8|nr:muscle-specific protein 300 kDa isoform X1 [Rhipicephalus sanguineus]
MGNRQGRGAGRVGESPGKEGAGRAPEAPDSSSLPQPPQPQPQQQQSVVENPAADGHGEDDMASSWQQQQKELHQQQRELEQQQQRRLQEQLAAARSASAVPPTPPQRPASSTPSPRQPPSPAGVRVIEVKADVWKPPGPAGTTWTPPQHQQPSPQFHKHVQFQTPPYPGGHDGSPTMHRPQPSPSPSPKPYRPPTGVAAGASQVHYDQPWSSTPPPQRQQQASPRSQPSPRLGVQQQQHPVQLTILTTPNVTTSTGGGAPSPRRVPLDVVPHPSGQRVWSEEPICEYVEPGGPSLAQQIAQQSQDYVDEKELEYRLAIQQLQNEQERVQKKVFMNWINNFLSQRTPPLRVDDVIEDLRDGTKLLALLECLSGQVLPRERARILRRPHFLSNVNTVLRFLEHRRIKLVNINATDVVDGKPAIVLGLIWTIILHFQIEEHTRLLAGSPASLDDSSLESTTLQEQLAAQPVSPRRPTAAERWKGGARKALLHWVKNSISQRFGVQVNDFGPSWRDGLAFLAIVHCIKPSLVDLDSAKKMDARNRLERAFSLADRELGIPRLLDPEDVDVPQPDERSVMTYVAQFLHKYPGTYATEQPLSPTVSSPTSAAPAQDDLSVLESFLKRAETTLQILQRPLTNLREEYQSYLNLCRDLDGHRELYARLGRRAARADSTVVLSQAWPLMESRWRAVESGLAQWRKRLDAALPGRLAQVAEWLAQTEERLRNDKLALGQMDAATVASKLAEHQSILSDLDEVKKWLADQKSSPAIVATVAPEHLADIEQRLEALSSLVCKRQLLLEMERRKLALMALVRSVEQHVAQLEQKHGSRPQVEELLRRHRDLLERDQVFQQFDRLFRELQEALDMCQRGSALGFQEVDDQARFLSDIHDHWTKLSARLRTSGNILSEVVVQWQKYDALYGPMVQWLDQAEIALQSTLAQKQEFFQDLPAWNEKKKNVVESGDYLAATCRDDIASTIRAQVHSIKQRWDSLYPQMHPFLSSGESLRATQQFQTGLDNLKHWMQQAEHLLTAHVPCDVPSLEQHAEDLKRFQTTMEEQRSQYKALSRTAQVLVRDLSRTEVDKMMADMKKEKENQVRVEARCSQRLCTVTQVTSLVRALDADLDRLDRWLDKAEDAIATYAVPNTQSLVQEQLEKHRAFFSQLTPMRALLTTKNKTHREIREEVGACPGLDTSRVDARMAQLNDRFQNCASLAEQWERALQEAANRWENINDAEKKALDWLSKAEVHVSDRRDPEAARAFFSKPYEHILLRVIQTSKDVLATLPPEDHPAIEARVQHIKEKWKAVQQKLPRLNDDEIFSELRESFDRNLDTLNKELDEEQKLIDKGGNLRVILTRHEEYFNKSREMGTLQDCLEEMQQLAQSCPSHQAPLSDCQSRFRVLHERIVTTNRILQVPKDEWLEYSKKFNGLLSWMDQVDQRIEQLMQSDTSSASAYETQRTEFLDICETVDARRGDLDWLNQRLESLVPGMEPEEAKKEKERLAGLVARYGALLPVMETTTIVSETVSKCYLYREEVTQVTRWLREVRESKVVPEEIPLDSPEKLEQMVQKQKAMVEELEKRQGSVLESIKSGKDLQTVKGAPEFVSSDVKKLEEEWSQVYHEAVEKLDRMTKDSQRWQEFEKLRQEILRLLAQAEQELVNIGLLADMEQKKLEQCIKEKQEAAKKLQESMDSMLSRLRSLADELSTQLGPQRETLLRAELDKTERKTTTILTTVHETVHRLETAASKGTDLSDRLSRLSQWLDTAQDKLTAATEGPVPEQLEEVQVSWLTNAKALYV